MNTLSQATVITKARKDLVKVVRPLVRSFFQVFTGNLVRMMKIQSKMMRSSIVFLHRSHNKLNLRQHRINYTINLSSQRKLFLF